jgi:hypothetical protein
LRAEHETRVPHVVLLGDSILDNGAYTSGGPDVVTQLRQYAAAVEACLRHGRPLVLCTIYNGHFADVAFQRVATTFVALFDDVILRTAASRALPAVVTGAGLDVPATRVTVA